MTRRSLSVDAAIVGGGIAALWSASLLAKRGLSVVVCEPNGLGGVQTLASQGIIHGGAKYSSDRTAPLSVALNAMPDRWRACLEGAGEIDLRGVEVLAEKMHFHVGRQILELDDFVLDVAALVRRLAEGVANRIVALAVAPESLVQGDSGIERIDLGPYAIRARTYVFAAGAGNEALARRAGFAPGVMQLRPLRQTVARLREDPRLYVHWTADDRQAEPTLTITGHGPLLSIGGMVADAGAARSESAQIAAVRELLRQAFPDIALDGACFTTFVAVRAEPAARAIQDIPDAFVARHGNCLLCLPVKLSLAPRLGDLVLAEIGDLDPVPKSWPGGSNTRIALASSPYSGSSC